MIFNYRWVVGLCGCLMGIIAIFSMSFRIYSDDSVEMVWNNGLSMTQNAVKEGNMGMFLEGLKQMEGAYGKNKGRGDWCRIIGGFYYDYYYINGHMMKCDEKKGVKWLQKGAELGDFDAALKLFKHYKPEYTPHLFAPKKEWNEYLKRNDKCWKYAGIILNSELPDDFNNYLTLADAALLVGNDALAYKYFAKAADRGDDDAIQRVAKYPVAFDYLTSPETIYRVGISVWNNYKNAHFPVEDDKFKGLTLIEKSARLNYAPAQSLMGDCCLKGFVAEVDTLRAVSWYKLAAQNDDANATAKLGEMYLSGTGVSRNSEMAFEMLSRVKGISNRTNLLLGYCYLYGIGTEPDYPEARRLFTTYYNAHDINHERKYIYVDGVFVDFDYLLGLTYYMENNPKAVKLFEASLVKDSYSYPQRADLLFKLSKCYGDGRCGAVIDITKSEDMKSMALKYGNSEIDATNIKVKM